MGNYGLKQLGYGLIALQKANNFSITELMMIAHIVAADGATHIELLTSSNASVGTSKNALRNLISSGKVRSEVDGEDKRRKKFYCSEEFSGELIRHFRANAEDFVQTKTSAYDYIGESEGRGGPGSLSGMLR